MIPNRTSSPAKYPDPAFEKPADMLKSLLDQLLAVNNPNAWLHVDGSTGKGWLHDKLLGKAPWLEVATHSENSLVLNLGKQSPPDIHIPLCWIDMKEGLWALPVEQTAELADWMTDFFLGFTKPNSEVILRGSIQQ